MIKPAPDCVYGTIRGGLRCERLFSHYEPSQRSISGQVEEYDTGKKDHQRPSGGQPRARFRLWPEGQGGDKQLGRKVVEGIEKSLLQAVLKQPVKGQIAQQYG